MSSSQPKQPVTIAQEIQSTQPSNSRNEPDTEDTKLWGSKRLVVVIYMFIGFVHHYLIRGNLSIAIVEMTSDKTTVVGNQTITQAAEFEWDTETEGWILSMFSYGYLFSVIGGYLSTKLGGGTVYGLGILVAAVLTVISPFALKANLYLFMACRIVEGIFEGFSYASSCDLCSRWIPKHELALLVTLSQSGIYYGSAITLPLCGYIALRWGWPMIFYFSGIVTLIWCVARDITYPWRKIFTSKPLWALCFGKFAYSWTYSFVVNCIPLYVKDLTNETTAEVGYLSGIPSYANMIVAPLIGYLVQYLQNNFGFDATKVHKWTISIGFLIGGILFLFISFTGFTGSMICFVIIIVVLSGSIMVLQLVIIHMAPDHSGVVAGISAFWFTLSSLGNPLAIGYIVTNHTWQQWNICFILSGIILIIGALVTMLFGSSENQNWSSTEDQKSEETLAQ